MANQKKKAVRITALGSVDIANAWQMTASSFFFGVIDKVRIYKNGSNRGSN
tara:strand:- start:1070 stop:1222 length:153 start_codon:yes stop_codon:yes gene_type:complete